MLRAPTRNFLTYLLTYCVAGMGKSRIKPLCQITYLQTERFESLCQITNHISYHTPNHKSFQRKSQIKENHIWNQIWNSRSSTRWKHLAANFANNNLKMTQNADNVFSAYCVCLPISIRLSAKVIEHCIWLRPAHVTHSCDLFKTQINSY